MLSCSVTYSGNIPPQMQWRKVGNALESMKISNCGIIGNRSVCNATLEANLGMGSSVYICEITTAEQYNCSLKVNKTVCKFTILGLLNTILSKVAQKLFRHLYSKVLFAQRR